MRFSNLHTATFTLFVMSILYIGSVLPCGRFYYDINEGFFGNVVLKMSYQYVYLYLGFIIHIIDVVEKRYNNMYFATTYNHNVYKKEPILTPDKVEEELNS